MSGLRKRDVLRIVREELNRQGRRGVEILLESGPFVRGVNSGSDLDSSSRVESEAGTTDIPEPNLDETAASHGWELRGSNGVHLAVSENPLGRAGDSLSSLSRAIRDYDTAAVCGDRYIGPVEAYRLLLALREAEPVMRELLAFLDEFADSVSEVRDGGDQVVESAVHVALVEVCACADSLITGLSSVGLGIGHDSSSRVSASAAGTADVSGLTLEDAADASSPLGDASAAPQTGAVVSPHATASETTE